MNKQKDLLIISGFDPSGGAGLLRDKAVAKELKISSDTIISSLTVQNSVKFDSFYSPNLEYFKNSIRFFRINKYKACKVGLITDISLAKILYDEFINTEFWNNISFKILDTVLKASAGKSLFWDNNLTEYMLKYIIPNFTLITPNTNEAKFLAKFLALDYYDIKSLTKKLANALKISVFITGGDEDKIIDYFYEYKNQKLFIREAEKILLKDKHGTGCTFSTALSSFVIQGNSLIKSGKLASKYVENKLSLHEYNF